VKYIIQIIEIISAKRKFATKPNSAVLLSLGLGFTLLPSLEMTRLHYSWMVSVDAQIGVIHFRSLRVLFYKEITKTLISSPCVGVPPRFRRKIKTDD
jgi:hypothetical protein